MNDKIFLGKNYLLKSKTAQAIYSHVKDLPVVDPHNHANVAEIAENRNYANPWQLFAATDHYVWEVLRKRDIPEKYITGDAAPEVKWMKMAEVFPEIAGNPVYEWIHLDLRRYLGIDDLLGPKTGGKIWEKVSAVLKKQSSRPQQLLDKIGVEVMCSTDDPADLLDEHRKANRDMGRTLIRPTWRPDKFMNIHSPKWKESLSRLESRFGTQIRKLDDLLAALRNSHDYFDKNGCRASDHGVEAPCSGTADKDDAEKVFKTALSGGKLTRPEAQPFMDYILGEMAEMDSEKSWVFQYHIGAVRDIRGKLFFSIGPDTGGDVSNHALDILPPLRTFLNRFDDRLKVVLYCLDPSHQPTLASASRAFGSKVSLGSAWWLCDTPIGMRRQLEYIGSVDLLANFAGMVSDSRKLLSYGSRFEMFRRILSDVLGDMVNYGQIPRKTAAGLAERICYTGPKELFGI